MTLRSPLAAAPPAAAVRACKTVCCTWRPPCPSRRPRASCRTCRTPTSAQEAAVEGESGGEADLEGAYEVLDAFPSSGAAGPAAGQAMAASDGGHEGLRASEAVRCSWADVSDAVGAGGDKCFGNVGGDVEGASLDEEVQESVETTESASAGASLVPDVADGPSLNVSCEVPPLPLSSCDFASEASELVGRGGARAGGCLRNLGDRGVRQAHQWCRRYSRTAARRGRDRRPRGTAAAGDASPARRLGLQGTGRRSEQAAGEKWGRPMRGSPRLAL
ncbi:unnamed protein product [Prorocentrum cordatum]|uniref:Uncharacterized protein n=1 Tax=Prorocentrum cordatum TaxID=2364126 RepID=A0ABN9R2Q3_9DINO|nr:unnamed protein product [Polarella glacialis]